MSTIQEKEAVASLRLLVAVARADKVVTPEEKESLKEAMAGLAFPPGVDVDLLLQEDINLNYQLDQIDSEAGREQAYLAAYFMAHADAECSPEEEELLKRIRDGLKIEPEKVSTMTRLVAEARDTVSPSSILKIDDPERSLT